MHCLPGNQVKWQSSFLSSVYIFVRFAHQTEINEFSLYPVVVILRYLRVLVFYVEFNGLNASLIIFLDCTWSRICFLKPRIIATFYLRNLVSIFAECWVIKIRVWSSSCLLQIDPVFFMLFFDFWWTNTNSPMLLLSTHCVLFLRNIKQADKPSKNIVASLLKRCSSLFCAALCRTKLSKMVFNINTIICT